MRQTGAFIARLFAFGCPLFLINPGGSFFQGTVWMACLGNPKEATHAGGPTLRQPQQPACGPNPFDPAPPPPGSVCPLPRAKSTQARPVVSLPKGRGLQVFVSSVFF